MKNSRLRRRKNALSNLTQVEVSENRVLLAATLVADINQNGGLLNAYGTEFNGKYVFAADHPRLGNELWVSDGTEPGTFLLKDLNFGFGSSSPQILGELNGSLLFSANVGGDETLWKTDGTSDGTVEVIDISESRRTNTFTFFDAVLHGGYYYFAADDGKHGDELWRTDGTAIGTTLVVDIVPGSNGTVPRNFVVFNNEVYFFSSLFEGGLWKTDGTESGTLQVSDLTVGELFAAGDTLFFAGRDEQNGTELWKTDGTPGGEELVKDVHPGPSSSFGSLFAHTGLHALHEGDVYFTADDGTHGVELWKSDGTPDGTVLVKDIEAGSAQSDPFGFVNLNGLLYFGLYDGSDEHLWRTDGTESGTQPISDLIPVDDNEFVASFDVIGDRLVTNVTELDENQHYVSDTLWTTDGTPDGSEVLFSYDASIIQSEIILNTVGNEVYFEAYHEGQTLLWKSDGTKDGTLPITSLYNPPSSFSDPVNLNGTVYFSTDDGIHGPELWISDGTANGTSLLKDIYPGITGSEVHGITATEDNIFFFANSSDSVSNELWNTDGTPEGTTPIRAFSSLGDIQLHADSLYSNGTLFFIADDGVSGLELWRSDGTTAGTMLVTDLVLGSEGSEPSLLGSYDGRVWFSTYDEATDTDTVWVSDGTGLGTIQLASGLMYVNVVGVAGDLMYFSADDGTHGEELWKSDGTVEGTAMVADINTGNSEGSGIYWGTSLNGQLYFNADDGVHGDELWTSDGTEAGTVMVVDINPSDTGDIRELTTVGGLIFLYTDDGVHGHELWSSDGTSDGTRLVRDIMPGESGSLTFFGEPDFVVGKRNVYFFVRDPGVEVANGTEGVWWQSDGTSEGTKRITGGELALTQTIFAGVTELGDSILFLASDGDANSELWSTELSEPEEGNIDGDSDFDANDSFLIHLVNLGGTNEQIDQSKGSSPFTGRTIRNLIDGIAGDVDGDDDFDANDSFLIHLVKLSGTNAQIDQSKGSSPLSATTIRARIESLGRDGVASPEQFETSYSSRTVSKFESDEPGMAYHSQLRSSDDATIETSAELFGSDFRRWIDVL